MLDTGLVCALQFTNVRKLSEKNHPGKKVLHWTRAHRNESTVFPGGSQFFCRSHIWLASSTSWKKEKMKEDELKWLGRKWWNLFSAEPNTNKPSRKMARTAIKTKPIGPKLIRIKLEKLQLKKAANFLVNLKDKVTKHFYNWYYASSSSNWAPCLAQKKEKRIKIWDRNKDGCRDGRTGKKSENTFLTFRLFPDTQREHKNTLEWLGEFDLCCSVGCPSHFPIITK